MNRGCERPCNVFFLFFSFPEEKKDDAELVQYEVDEAKMILKQMEEQRKENYEEPGIDEIRPGLGFNSKIPIYDKDRSEKAIKRREGALRLEGYGINENEEEQDVNVLNKLMRDSEMKTRQDKEHKGKSKNMGRDRSRSKEKKSKKSKTKKSEKKSKSKKSKKKKSKRDRHSSTDYSKLYDL